MNEYTTSNAQIDIMEMTEKIQNECHEVVDYVLQNSTKKITVQDATNVYIFQKLASIELRLAAITEKITLPSEWQGQQ